MGFYDDLNSDPLAPKPPDYFYPAYGPDNNPLAGVVMPENHPLGGLVSPDQYPDLSTASTTAFRQPGATPAIPTSPLGKYAYEPAQKLPAQGMWGNWLDNLATSLATTPMQAPNNFGGGLLSGFAKGFSTARLGKMSEREKLQKAMDDYAAKRNEANIKATTDAAAARQKRLEDLRADIDKRRRDRDDLLYKTMLEASVKANADGTFTLTEGEAKAMGAGYTAGQTVPKEIKVEALTRTRPDKGGAGKSPDMVGNYTEKQHQIAGQIVNDMGGSNIENRKWIDARDSWDRLMTGAAQKNGFGDLQMVYAMVHLIEPGSNVMEGENKNAREAAGKFEKLKNLPKAWFTGDNFNDYGRLMMIRMGQQNARNQYKNYSEAMERYVTRARTARLNPEDFGIGYQRNYDFGPDYNASLPKDAKPAPGMIIVETPDGRRFMMDAKLKNDAIKNGGRVVG